MATVDSIRDALANRLSTISGLRVSANLQGQITPPMAIVAPQPGQMVRFETMDGGVNYTFIVYLFVAYTEDTSSQALLDGYLDPGGTGSVIGVLRADQTLGGACHWAVPTAVAAYGLSAWGGQDYFGTRVMVSVSAD